MEAGGGKEYEKESGSQRDLKVSLLAFKIEKGAMRSMEQNGESQKKGGGGWVGER